MPVLKTCATQAMVASASCFFFLHNVSERTPSKVLAFISLFFCGPVFQFSNFCFKIAYTIQQRELILIGRKCASLGGNDYSVEFNNLLLDDGSIADAYHRRSNFARCLERTGERYSVSNVDQGDLLSDRMIANGVGVQQTPRLT